MIKPKKSVQEMQAYNPPLEGRRDYLRLDFNENTAGPADEVIRALRKIEASDLCTYPEYDRFKKRLAAYLGAREDEIAITDGSDEAIKLVIDVYMEKDEKILLAVPTYPMFKFYAQLAGVGIKEVLYNEDLSYPAEKMLDEIDDATRVIVLVNPNSPTGTLIREEDVFKILKRARNSIVIIDEAYCQFSGKSFKKYINDYDNLLIIQTFSKAFGLAGLRLGYILSNKENIKALSKAASPYSVNSLAVIAASKALEKSSYVERYVKEVKEAREILEKALRKLGVKTYDSRTNFVLADFGNNAELVESKLKKKGILVRNQSEKPLLKGCVRITAGTKEQTRKFVKSLNEIYEAIK